MRRVVVFAMALGLLLSTVAAPAAADHRTVLEGPNPAIWLSDPEGDVGPVPDFGIEQGDPVAGSSGRAEVYRDRATIKVRAKGLVPGHTYTMWVVYFSDSTLCTDLGSGNVGCNGEDLTAAGGGVIWGDGDTAGRSGKVTFNALLNTGDSADNVGPPPPFAKAPYEAGPNNEFHVVIRSHGPQIPGLVDEQVTTFLGGCFFNVGPLPEEKGDFRVPLAPGECGDVQLYVFK